MGRVPILLSILLCFFSKKDSLCSQQCPLRPLSGYASQWDWAQRLLKSICGSGSLMFPSFQLLGCQTTRQVMKSTGGEDFLNASMATILAVRVCVCEQLNILSFLYLLVPFLYPVPEKTFYSFLVQKKLGLLCRSAVFNYVTPPTLSVFLGTHLPAEGFIRQPSALSQPLRSPCLLTPNLLPRELAGSEPETVPSRMWESLILPTPTPKHLLVHEYQPTEAILQESFCFFLSFNQFKSALGPPPRL